MNKLMKLGLTILVVLIGGYFAIQQIYPSATVRYKITVSVETPDGIKTGSAVREFRARRNLAKIINPDVGTIERQVIGEAAVVNMGSNRLLYALIDWDSYKEIESAFPASSSDPVRYIHFYNKLKPGSTSILRANYPKIVTFKDISDPSTIQLVYQNKSYENGEDRIDNFAKILGGDVRLREISIEITEDPVFSDSLSKLPFLASREKFTSWRNTLKYGDPLIVDRSNFIRE